MCHKVQALMSIQYLCSRAPSAVHVCMQVSWDMLQQSESPPLLWSAEEPHLYVLVLSVLTPAGNVIEAESTQVSV